MHYSHLSPEELKHRLRLVESLSKTAFWSYDLKTGQLNWDSRMHEIYDVPVSDFKGVYDDWKDRVHPEDIEDAERAFHESVATDGKFHYEFRVVTSQGVRHVRAAAFGQYDDKGEIRQMMGINVDKTLEIEQQLKELEAADMYRILIQQNPNATAMVDKEMRYVAASEKWLSDYHLEGQNVIGKSHYDIFPEIGDEWKSIHKKCLAGEGSQRDIDRFERADGSVQYLRWNLQPWYLPGGDVGGIIMFSEDITKRVQSEEEGAEIRSILRGTQELAQIGVWEFDLRTESVKWDHVVRRIHGVDDHFEPDTNTAINFYKEGASRDAIANAFETQLKSGDPYDLELVIVDVEGREKWVRAIGNPSYDEAGNIIKVSGLFQDIDAQKRAEIERELLLNRFENAFQFSPNGMALVGLDGRWTKVNDKLCELLGYEEEELLGLTFQDVTHPEDLDADLHLVKECLDGVRTSYEMEKRYFRKDGDVVNVILAVSLLRDTSHQPVHFVSQIQDITPRVHAMNNLKASNEQLQLMAERLSQHNRSLMEFAHITSHNLRAPVGNLLAMSNFYDEFDDAEKPGLVAKIKSEIVRLAETLDDLVEVLAIRENAERREEDLKLEDLLQNTLSSLENYIAESRLQVTSDFSVGCTVRAYKPYMESIFLNFTTNAIKYRRSDTIPTFHVSTTKKDEFLEIRFTDNGLGIDMERNHDKVFGLYKTFHRNTDSKGVGLFMVKAHAEAMGGSVSVESQKDMGSTFIVRLPLSRLVT